MISNKIKKEISPFGEEAMEYIDSLLTFEEIEASNIRISLMQEVIKAREEKGLSQRELEKISGVKQPIISRMEQGSTNPQLDTILKVLIPLGKTLKIVSLE